MGNDPTILDLSAEERVRLSAFRHACPRPASVINKYGKQWFASLPGEEQVWVTSEQIREHGIEAARARYDECDFVFTQWICGLAQKYNPDLLKKLTSPTLRQPSEPVGIFERNRVPRSHMEDMSPLSTLVGYALPRVFIEGAGRGKDRTWERYFQTMETLERLIKESQTPAELLAKLAEAVTQQEADPIATLSHVLEPGILDEENNHIEYSLIAEALAQYAPSLWKKYQSLTPQERQEKGIINFPTRLKEFPWEKRPQPVSFVETVSVVDGVTCDVYTFDQDSGKDLGIIKIQAGKSTPVQKVLDGERTIEGHIFGKGKLVVTRADGKVETTNVGDDPYEMISVTVMVGDTMQWQADPNSNLIAFEVCFPPYKDGRYENVG